MKDRQLVRYLEAMEENANYDAEEITALQAIISTRMH